ncbi:RNA polymerase sigma factor [Planctomycetaceae bacterium SH139]
MKYQEQERILATWFSHHHGLMLKIARAFASESNDRDDLLQEIALQVWRSIPRYQRAVAESTWIYRVALYTAISWARKERKRTNLRSDLPVEPVAQQQPPDPRLDWLYQKISELQPVDRAIALLLLDGFSYREISQAIGISESNVGVRINRIKNQLTKKLSREKDDEI